MPANLTPEYYKADQWYREATSTDEKILALEQMLRVIPKHKGTDHMRADLRRKLSKLKEAGAKKSGSGGHVDIFHVPRGGCGQVVLIGVPNSGKSAVVGMLTNAKVNIADFPYATNGPVPGMVQFEDVQIQLIDMPPITEEFMMPGQVGTYRNGDLIAIVIDLSQDVESQWKTLMDFLQTRRLLADEQTPTLDEQGNALGKRAFILCTKSDAAENGAMEKTMQLNHNRFEIVNTSAETLDGFDTLAIKLYEMLQVIRIYSKPPGKEADMTEPFTLPNGSTVIDLAKAVHRQLAEKLKSARIWGTGVYDGQQVQLHHVLHDKDIVELHFS